MQTLLSLSPGNFLTVDLYMQGSFVLTLLVALLSLLSLSCVEARFRFPLILTSTALAGSGWFLHGEWRAWRGAFELAGSSYCVTGWPLAPECAVIAWAIGIPTLVWALGIATTGLQGRALQRLGQAVLLMSLLSFVTRIGALVTYLGCLWLLRDELIKPGTTRLALRIATGAILLECVITGLGSLHLLPVGTDAETALARSEVLRSIALLVALVIPALSVIWITFLRQKTEPPEFRLQG